MDSIKLTSYGLLAVQLLFMAWLLSSIRGLKPNASIIVFELILAASMLIVAICLVKGQHYQTGSNRSINDL